MFTTSMTALVVASLLSSNAAIEQPTWQTDYAKAMKVSVEAQKPIAVFIAAGNQNQVVSGEGFGPEVTKLLKEKFVPLHIDTTTAQGKKLAESFALNQGLIISDRTGGLQALRHDGQVSSPALKGYLEQYSVGSPVVTTVSNSSSTATVVPASYSVPYSTPVYSRCVGGNCGGGFAQPGPIVNTLQNVGGFIQAAPSAIYGSFGGTCRGGNCPR